MDIYKCPKSETQKNFPFKNFNILNNKLGKILKAVCRIHLVTNFKNVLYIRKRYNVLYMLKNLGQNLLGRQ